VVDGTGATPRILRAGGCGARVPRMGDDPATARVGARAVDATLPSCEATLAGTVTLSADAEFTSTHSRIGDDQGVRGGFTDARIIGRC